MRRLFSLDGLAPAPWKNGGGVTRELACWPSEAGLDTFDWRVSIATVAESGPFSVFPGVDRRIMLLEGGGMRLLARDGDFDQCLDTPLQSSAFPGDVRLDCTLLDAASTDFNVMTRRGRCEAELRPLTCAAPLAPTPHGLLLALRGDWVIHTAGHASAVCPARHGLWWADDEGPHRIEPAAAARAGGTAGADETAPVLLVVSIRPQAPSDALEIPAV